MTLIEGIGDEVTHFFIALIAIIIVSLAWWTTNISEQRHVRTVLLLDRRRHRSGHHRRLTNLTNHTEAVTITEGSASATPRSAETTAEMRSSENGPETVENANGSNDSEESTIIRTMDAETCSLRQRRLAFYDNFSQNNSQDEVDSRVEEIPNQQSDENATGSQKNSPKSDSTIRIKLKYINDDLKFVDGHLNEPLGDFKKRHFQVEMNSNKLVRLIFNGQVLQQDTQTLQSIGLFDNCVVHCLVHQKRVVEGDNSNSAQNRENSTDGVDNSLANANNNNNNQAIRDWDFGNSLFAFISFMLLAAWYFRYVYAHLYTVTATVGLILITGIFTIVLVGMYFPDNENLPTPRIHIHTAMPTERENAPQPAQQ